MPLWFNSVGPQIYLVASNKLNIHVPDALIPSHVIQFHVFKSDRAKCTLYIIHLSLFMKQNTGIITVVQDKKVLYRNFFKSCDYCHFGSRNISYPNGSYKKTTRSLIHFVWTSGKHVHF